MRNVTRCFSWLCVWSLVSLSAASTSGCSSIKFPGDSVHCKTHTYINLVFTDYLKQRFHSKEAIRMAIVPFDVPETFAPVGNESVHYGRELARKFHAEMNRTGAAPIVELFNRDRWPGKRAEFFTGNYGAIDIARAAGYDFVLVGYLEDIKDANTLELSTKVIDTQNQVTVWSAKTDVTSNARAIRSTLSAVNLEQKRPDLFEFPARTQELARCTVDAILNGDPVPE